MRTIKCIVFLLLFSLTWLVGFGQKRTLTNPLWVSVVKFDSIIGAGYKQIYMQLCDTTIESKVNETSTVTFLNAIIDNIQHCRYEHQLQNDSIRKTIVSTKKRIYTIQLLMQMQKQYGNSISTTTEGFFWKTTTYKWKPVKHPHHGKINIVVTTKRKTKKGVATLSWDD
ncbi:MAG: hypothetical protein JKX95_00010 [Bacteroidia bacterium]|nr:hypothetical protein [Bacteroidia bacterium]